ncbi:MAG TPA: hypothetical protein VMF58_15895 [Rhizomicrobium sp.]|nr:hypothetical protein [Rhizomicrobium sp.]
MIFRNVLAAATVVLAFSQAFAATAPSYTAVVNSDGSLARGLHAASATRLGKGTYEVDFTHDVTTCGYTATIGLSGTGGVSDPGAVTIVGRSGTPDGLYIQTFSQKGKPADLGFHVIVAC